MITASPEALYFLLRHAPTGKKEKKRQKKKRTIPLLVIRLLGYSLLVTRYSLLAELNQRAFYNPILGQVNTFSSFVNYPSLPSIIFRLENESFFYLGENSRDVAHS